MSFHFIFVTNFIRDKNPLYGMCFIVLSVAVCTVGYICVFRGDQIFVDFVSFLSTIIYEVLYK